MKYDLEEIVNNPKANATIFFPSNGTPDPYSVGKYSFHAPIQGLVESDFTLDVASSYEPVDGGSTLAQSGYNIAQSAAGGANRVIKNVQQTLQRWNGHSYPTFTVPIIIVKYKKEIDILDIVRTLVAAPAGTYDGLTLKAPYGYGWDGGITTISEALSDLTGNSYEAVKKIADTLGNKKYTPTQDEIAKGSALYSNISHFVTGTWTLSYSDWFIASDLIITHVSATISKETVKGTNEPLYARINVTFTTSYLPDARTIANYFLPRYTDNGSSKNTNITGIAGQGNNNNAPI